MSNTETSATIASEISLENMCKNTRIELKGMEAILRHSLNNEIYNGEQKYKNQHGEMKAQTMLAIRHIEDARMRIGKILQYADDGISILDK